MFVLLFIYSGVFAGTKLCRGGMSAEVRRKVMKRHVTFSIAYMFTMCYPFICSFFIFNNFEIDAENGYYQDNLAILFFKVIFGFSGVIFPLLRLLEPFFYGVIIDKWTKICCCKSRNRDVDNLRALAPLTTFLASSFNVELVYIILKGIT